MSLTALKAFVLKTKTIQIYNGDDITFTDDAKKTPTLKNQQAPTIPLEVHAITAAQMDHIQTLRNSVAPPMVTQLNNGVSNSVENTSDPAYLTAKEKADNLSTALVVYYGCDSIRNDTLEAVKQNDNTDEQHELRAQAILNALPLPVIEDICRQILSINHPGVSADFFSAGSSANTPS
jgi:hypothetical protein